MPDIKRGLIFTNDRCVGCHRCIADCPIPGANVSVLRNGMRRIEVDGDKCIHCGHCLSSCRHNAREYMDDTDSFFDHLTAGDKISVIVSPSFYVHCPSQASHILGFLRSLGVGKIYDASFGADIMMWAYLEYMDRNPSGGRLSSFCPSVINYLEHYRPDLLEHLMPFQSPAVCTAIYAEKYLGDKARFAYIGPCIAQKDNFHSQFIHSSIRYNITTAHLLAKLRRVNISGFKAEADLTEQFSGNMLPLDCGLKDCIGRFLPPDKYIMRMDNMLHMFGHLDELESSYAKTGVRPYLTETLCCDYGCLNGSGTSQSIASLGVAASSMSRLRSQDAMRRQNSGGWEQQREKLKKTFSDLRLDDFSRNFADRYSQPNTMPEDVYNEIFNAMHKVSDQDRNMNCGSCGYSTCRDMALAIGFGYNKLADCVHFSQAETMRLYLTDDLTGIPNLVSFTRDVLSMRQASPGCRFILGVFDIKGFKVINDLYGFDEGNRALRYIAAKMAEYVKDLGFCARMYADRFAICIPDSTESLDQLYKFSEKTCASYDLYYPLSLDFGFYRPDDTSLSVRLMLDFAQLAQRSVKGSFKMRHAFYDKKMRESILQEAQITAEMRSALSDNQFRIYLQPQYNHKTRSMTGAEVLVRWIHPDRGIISPAIFIPVFEKNGFITMLDKFVWEQACILLRKWLDNGDKAVPLSVNLSRLDLYDPELINIFTGLIKKYNLPTELLKLEITESAYVENASQLIGIVTRLQQHGFIIEMDDFGSGYSSLNSLKDVPVDILKLDLKFISEDNSGRGGNILQSIIRMARWLSLPVIAEGVETLQQADYLVSVGCEIIQGFYYSRPVPVSDFEKMMNTVNRGAASEPSRIKSWTSLSELWAPGSQIPILMNTCFGGAGIFEYCDGQLEALCVNDYYHESIGVSAEQFDQMRNHLMDVVYPDDLGTCLEMLNKALHSGEEAECESRWRVHPERPDEILWLHIKVRALAQRDNRCVLFCAIENITSQKDKITTQQ